MADARNCCFQLLNAVIVPASNPFTMDVPVVDRLNQLEVQRHLKNVKDNLSHPNRKDIRK